MFLLTLILIGTSLSLAEEINSIENYGSMSSEESSTDAPIGCLCGIFLSNTTRRNKDPPTDKPVLQHKLTHSLPCTAAGDAKCIKKCVNFILRQHIRNSAEIICRALGRDCYRERAYLFVKNCKDKWINSSHSHGQYCCKNSMPYKCSKSNSP